MKVVEASGDMGVRGAGKEDVGTAIAEFIGSNPGLNDPRVDLRGGRPGDELTVRLPRRVPKSEVAVSSAPSISISVADSDIDNSTSPAPDRLDLLTLICLLPPPSPILLESVDDLEGIILPFISPEKAISDWFDELLLCCLASKKDFRRLSIVDLSIGESDGLGEGRNKG
jgi:hypothetical protein